MRKAIIAVCKWIIAKLSVVGSNKDGKRRFKNKRTKNYPEHTKRRSYHRGCWVATPSVKSYYPTQKQAAEALSRMFDLDIYRHDVYNALYHKDGELYYGKKFLCKVSYDKEI